MVTSMNAGTVFFHTARFTTAIALQVLLVVFLTTSSESCAPTQVSVSVKSKPSTMAPVQQTLKPVSSEKKVVVKNTSFSQLSRSLEVELFFQKSLELLSQFNAEDTSALAQQKSMPKYAQAGLCGERCYQKKILYYVETEFKSLQKKYRSKIKHCQTKPAKTPELHVTIKRDGRLASINLIKTSGNKAFDNLFMQAFKKAAPFPSIPQHMLCQQITFCT